MAKFDDILLDEDQSTRRTRAEAMHRLRRLIETKKRGDLITAEEIVQVTGLPNWQSFGIVIRRHVLSLGMVPQSVRNDGYRIVGAAEHIDEAERCRRKALKQEVRSLHAANAAPVTELEDAQVRRLEFVRARAQQRVDTALKHEREARKELTAGHQRERAPRLPK